MGLVISMVKQVEEDERRLAVRGSDRNVAGASFWIWLSAMVVMAAQIFLSGLAGPEATAERKETTAAVVAEEEEHDGGRRGGEGLGSGNRQ